MNEPDRAELRRLMGALSDNTIVPEEHTALERMLTESAEARQSWFLHSDIETGLADWAATRRETKGIRVVPSLAVAPAPRRVTWNWIAPLAAAAFLMLGVFWWVSPSPKTVVEITPETPARGMAVLERAVGAAWSDGNEYAAGAILPVGRLKLTAGAALVEFYSGARMVLEAPAEFEVISPAEAFLHAGKISAHVPPQARGFTVRSASLTVVDLGTDFGFEVKPGAAAEVHVFTGKVEVTSKELPTRPLTRGQAARISARSVTEIPVARSAFLAEDELARRDEMTGLQRFRSWRDQHRVLSTDPATVIHYTFEEVARPDRRVANQSAAAPPEDAGSLVGCFWEEGRWPGKQALGLRREADRVRLSAAGMQRAATFLAWVRVEALPNSLNTLFSTATDQPGSMHWHVTNAGELRLSIARDLGHTDLAWEAVNSAPFLTPARMGQWVMLASTFDGSTIRHYGNGALIGSGASFTPPALSLGAAELGNWPGKTVRNLMAAIDEFALLSRALSPDEIRAIYDQGRP